MPRDGQLGGTADGAHDAMSVHGLAGGKQMPGDERRRSAESLESCRRRGRAGHAATPGATRRDHRARARARTRAPRARRRQHPGDVPLARRGFDVVEREVDERGNVDERPFAPEDGGDEQNLARRR